MRESIYKVFSCLLLVLSCFFFYVFLLIRFKETSYFIEWEIFNINGVSIVISIIADKISISFLSVVSLIAGFIIIYSIYYIEGDFNFVRFSFILLRFVTSMAFLIIRPNLISILLVVAERMELTYVLNTTTSTGDLVILYASEDYAERYNITEAVMEELGMF